MQKLSPHENTTPPQPQPTSQPVRPSIGYGQIRQKLRNQGEVGKGFSILVEKLYAKGKNNGQKLHIAMHITRWKTTDKAKPNFEYLKIKFVHNIWGT